MFDKNYAGETDKSKQFSEKPKYLNKLLLHKKCGTRQLLVDCFLGNTGSHCLMLLQTMMFYFNIIKYH
jgi:hypothetical protein